MKDLIKYYSIILIVLIITGKINAQDIHFSQFYALPMNLNPALTALSDDKVSLGHRQQGTGSISEKYVTNYLGFEKSTSLKNKDFVGYGLFVLSDKTAKNGIHRYSISASGSYSKKLNKIMLSSGLQCSYTQKGLFGEFTLPDDQDKTYTAIDVLNGAYRPINQLNINAGVLSSIMFNEYNTAYIGISSFYLNQAKESFNNLEKINLKSKTSLHAGVRLYTSEEKKIAIIPHVRTMIMNKASNILVGTNLEYYYSPKSFDFISLGGCIDLITLIALAWEWELINGILV